MYNTLITIQHAHYEHILGHKGRARAPSAPWLDPPLANLSYSRTEGILQQYSQS